MRVPVLLSIALAACTSAEPRPQPAAAAPPASPLATDGARPPTQTSARWYWNHNPSTERGVVRLPGTDAVYRIVGDGPLRVELVQASAVAFDRELPDSRDHDAAVLVLDGDALYVAHHSGMATGTTLARLDASDGRVLWTTALYGAGPIDHSKYHNEVQLAVEDGMPVVYGHESGGSYTEIVDATTGTQIGHGVPPQALVDLPWTFARSRGSKLEYGDFAVEWDDVPPQGTVELTSVRGRYVFREGQRDAAAVLELHDADGVAWSLSLPGDGTCGRAAMLELDARLYVVRWCAIATGATLLAVDPDGQLVHSRPLRALPNIGHSEYLAAVQLRAVDGWIVVFGNEAAGKYLEAIDPATGATVVSRTFL